MKTKHATKTTTFLLFTTLLFTTLLPIVHAFGISPGITTILLDANHTDYDAEVNILNTNHEDLHLTLTAEGNLAPYLKLPTDDIHVPPDQEMKTVTYHLVLPQTFYAEEPLEAVLTIAPTTTPETRTGINAVTSGNLRIIAKPPEPEKKIRHDLRVNERTDTVLLTITVTNTGDHRIGTLDVTTTITNAANTTLHRSAEKTTNLEPNDHQTFTLTLPKNKLPPGAYTATVLLSFDSKETTEHHTFTVDTDKILQLTLTPPEPFTLGTINQLTLELTNNAALPLDNVQPTLTILNDQGQPVTTLAAPLLTVPAHGTTTTPLPWDTTNLTPGTYTATLTLKAGTLTYEKTYTLTLTETTITVKQHHNLLDAPWTLPLSLLALLLTLTATAFLLLKRKKRRKNQHAEL